MCCVLQKVFYEIENYSVKSKAELVSGFADLVHAFRNCVTSKDFVCKQLKKVLSNNIHFSILFFMSTQFYSLFQF